jgi:hypothetical protein
MKKLLLIAALLSANLLFASHGSSSSGKCDLKYNHCMGDCSVKYGSDTECVSRCKANYENCKAGLHTENYTAPKAAGNNTEKSKHEKKTHH